MKTKIKEPNERKERMLGAPRRIEGYRLRGSHLVYTYIYTERIAALLDPSAGSRDHQLAYIFSTIHTRLYTIPPFHGPSGGGEPLVASVLTDLCV